VTQLRHSLETLELQSTESDPVAAAIRMRRLLRHRALVILCTDLDDASVSSQLARAVGLLCPPHLVVVAGVQGQDVAALASAEAHHWQDPWNALAAREHQQRAATQRLMLQRLGAPVVAAAAERLEQAVFDCYAELRRARRV
jgi:uncharacterized protein (DUF58 family)